MDKLGALVKCGQHLGLFPNKVEIGGADGGPIILGIEVVTTTKQSNDNNHAPLSELIPEAAHFS